MKLFEKQQYESELPRLEKKVAELGNVLEKNNDFSELFDEVIDALDLVNLNFDDEDDLKN